MFRQFTRSMATATQSVRPPVQLFGLDGTYATALYTAAAKTTSIEAAQKSLASLQSVVEKDTKVGEFLENPALSSEDRAIVVQTLSKSVSGIDASVSNLIKVLGENNRLNLLPAVFKQFKILTDAHAGIVEAIVTSATKLDSKILKRVETSISKSNFVGSGKSLKLTNTVNPDILGGLVVEVGDRTVDLSIATKVARLNQALKESI